MRRRVNQFPKKPTVWIFTAPRLFLLGGIRASVSISLWVSCRLELAELLEAPGADLGDGCRDIEFSTYRILPEYRGGRKRIWVRGCALSTYPLGARMVGVRRLDGVMYVAGRLTWRHRGIDRPKEVNSRIARQPEIETARTIETSQTEVANITNDDRTDTASPIFPYLVVCRYPFCLLAVVSY